MIRSKALLLIGAVLGLMGLSAAAWAAGIPKDIVLVLDNSGSMRHNDPKFLAKKAVSDFIADLQDDTEAAVIIFDQKVDLAVPLTPVNDKTKAKFLASLKDINYRGRFTDSPAAMERAIYELKTNGRPNAEKSIIFMTDGIVDTGNAARDLDKSKWLRTDLAADAAKSGIRIFSIAFTENADFQLIQQLAQKTNGEYFRALTAEELSGVYKRIKAVLDTPPPAPKPPAPAPTSAAPAPAAAPAVPPPAATSAAAPEEAPLPVEGMPAEQPAQAPAASTQPAAPPAPVKEAAPAPAPAAAPKPVPQPAPAIEEPAPAGLPLWQVLLILGGAGTLVIVAVVVLLMRRRGQPPVQEEEHEYIPQAFFKDIHGITGQESYPLGAKPTMLGRVAGQDTEHLDYIVIKESTVGRRHALIEYKDYSYWIADQGSVNGTFVNGEKVTGEHRLKHGDRIKLHNYEFEFVMPEMADSGKTVFSAPADATVVSPPAAAAAAAGSAAAAQAATDALYEQLAGGSEAAAHEEEPAGGEEEEGVSEEQPAAAALLGEDWDIEIGTEEAAEEAPAAGDEAVSAEEEAAAEPEAAGPGAEAGEAAFAEDEQSAAAEFLAAEDEEATILREHKAHPDLAGESEEEAAGEEPEASAEGEIAEEAFGQTEEGLEELDSLFDSATFDTPPPQSPPGGEASGLGQKAGPAQVDSEAPTVLREDVQEEPPPSGEVSLDSFIDTSSFESKAEEPGAAADDRTVLLNEDDSEQVPPRDVALDEEESAEKTVMPSAGAGGEEGTGEEISLDDFISTSIWENKEAATAKPEDSSDKTVLLAEDAEAPPVPPPAEDDDAADKTVMFTEEDEPGASPPPPPQAVPADADADKTVLFSDDEDDPRTVLPSMVKDDDEDEKDESSDHYGDTTVFNVNDFGDPGKGRKR